MSDATITTQLTQGDKSAITKRNSDLFKERFIQLFSQTCNMSTAAEKLDIERSTVYYWLRTDPDFKEHFDQARADGVHHLEDVAFQRAEDTSDRVLALLLKAYKPERFGDRPIIASQVNIVIGWPGDLGDKEEEGDIVEGEIVTTDE